MKPPDSCYTIWFSQRSGTTVLCKALEDTGIAGKPGEFLNLPAGTPLYANFPGATNLKELREQLWEAGRTPNGIFGPKTSDPEPVLAFEPLVQSPENPDPSTAEIWETVFPNSQHIFVCRRNKVLQAVSWWKAIKTNVWHRQRSDLRKMGFDGELNAAHASPDLGDAYSFDAIRSLLNQCALRETKIQRFFDELRAQPYSLFYEDLARDFDGAVAGVLGFLGLDSSGLTIPTPFYEKLADEVSEEWAVRFTQELKATTA